MKRVYVETSFISYLTARPSSNITLLARQQAAHSVWALQGQKFEAFTSELVIDEITKGDVMAARRRVEVSSAASVLAITPEADNFATLLINSGAIPPTEPEDALHIAIATLSKMDYILSFNFAHMVGAESKFLLQTAIASLGYKPPYLVTADDLLEAIWN
jgi:predicted nucleic acid-binding protein